MKHLKKISEELLHSNTHWEYKQDVFELENGERRNYYFAECRGTVKIVPVLDDGRLVLILQYRYLQDRESIEFPAGGIEEQSDPLSCAQKELREETGCVADEWVKIGGFELSNGNMKNQAHVYLARVSAQYETKPEATEQIEVLYRRPDEIEEMIQRGDIWDGPTLAAWSLVRHHFLDEASVSEDPILSIFTSK